MERQATRALGATFIALLVAGCSGAGSGGSARIVHSTAVHESAPCTTRQLALSYLGGQPATGNDFGTLLVRDRSRRACALPGPLRVTGLDAAGLPVTDTVRFPLDGNTVLSADAGPITRRPGSGRLDGISREELVGMVGLQAEYRDGPATVGNGLCMPLWVIPAIWRVMLPDGHAITTPNADPANSFKLAPSGGLVTCRGKLGASASATVGSPAG
jgi:hypothetical protein